MGLRFRKSISLFPGVKLNFGKTGMSVSTGVPGFRKTFHTSGRVTTSVGIPGTGIYYVDTKNPRKQSNRSSSQRAETPATQPQPSYRPEEQSEIGRQTSCDVWDAYAASNESNNITPTPINHIQTESNPHERDVAQLDPATLKSIHKASDDTVDWTEVLVSPIAPDETYNQEMWEYYHSVASKVLSGDIDTYLQLIYEVNPLDDLLAYGGNYEFGTDNPQKIEVEFSANEAALSAAKRNLNSAEYNDLLQDFICSVCIRIARDMFALLPVSHVIVHAVLNGDNIVSADFDRVTLSKVKFGYIDPSETLSKFRHNMQFQKSTGFSKVELLE